jgi:hypothetical protein
MIRIYTIRGGRRRSGGVKFNRAFGPCAITLAAHLVWIIALVLPALILPADAHANDAQPETEAQLSTWKNLDRRTRFFTMAARTCVVHVRGLQARITRLPEGSDQTSRAAARLYSPCHEAQKRIPRIRGADLPRFSDGLVTTTRGFADVMSGDWHVSDYFTILGTSGANARYLVARAAKELRAGLVLLNRGLLLVDRERRKLGWPLLAPLILGP